MLGILGNLGKAWNLHAYLNMFLSFFLYFLFILQLFIQKLPLKDAKF